MGTNFIIKNRNLIVIMIKPTVTVFISAYNEEENIAAFINSVLEQKETNFTLKQILVVSDGSSDKTSEVVKSLRSPKIKLQNYEEREGKSKRLNSVYRTFQSDILVQSDADVVFSTKNVLEDIVAPLTNNSEVGLCGGNPIAIKGTTFTENSINVTHNMYRKFRKSIKGGNNVFSADGRLLALSKLFARGLYIPEDMIANDMYAYFSCLSKGFEYKYVASAVVWFRSPQNARDHIRQNSRFEAGPLRMEKYFDIQLVLSERSIPKALLWTSMFRELVKHPISSIYIMGLNTWCRLKAYRTESSMTALWGMAKTTKGLIVKFN